MHRGLAEMYVADERFTRTYDREAAARGVLPRRDRCQRRRPAEPCRAVVEPSRWLVEPCRGLVEPSRGLVEPCRGPPRRGRAHVETPQSGSRRLGGGTQASQEGVAKGIPIVGNTQPEEAPGADFGDSAGICAPASPSAGRRRCFGPRYLIADHNQFPVPRPDDAIRGCSCPHGGSPAGALLRFAWWPNPEPPGRILDRVRGRTRRPSKRRQSVIRMWPGWAATRSSQARIAGYGSSGNPPSGATWV